MRPGVIEETAATTYISLECEYIWNKNLNNMLMYEQDSIVSKTSIV